MNKIIYLCFCLFIILACRNLDSKVDDSQQISAETSPLINYYATIPLRESPYADFRGVVKLSKNESLKRKHYRFVYDSLFRLKSVSFMLGDTHMNPNHTSNYFFTTSEQRFSYETNKEVRTFYDRFGNQITQRNVHREIYLKDSMERYTTLYFEDLNGKRIENSWGIYQYSWELLNDGSVIEKRINKEGQEVSLRPGFDFYTIRLYYHQNGLLALMQNIDDQGNLKENKTGVAQDKLHFDKSGRWYGWTVLDAKHQIKRGNGPNVAKGINDTDIYGYERKIRYEDVDGSTIMNSYGFWGSKRFYDEYGNYKYTQFLDKNENPGINEKTGYSIAKYTWSQDGHNRIKVELLDTNNKPVLHKARGYSIIQQSYNQEGNLIKTSFLGVNNELINRIDTGTAYVVYTYDEMKKLIATKRFNKNDEEIK